MKDVADMQYFEPSEKVVQILMHKTQNYNPLFFRVMVAYYFAKVASMMRTDIKTKDRGIIPVNLYAMNLSASGSGKGFSTNVIEETVINKFRDRFTTHTYHDIAEKHIAKVANFRANKYGLDPDTMRERVTAEFQDYGALLFSFDSGTVPAIKQMRQQLLLANCGSINFEMDEFASNFLGNNEALNAFLELYDVGKIKQKLVKNTKENRRGEEMYGRTPTNMMLYGTPAKLLAGGKVEEEFYSMLETGYARRCLFGFSKQKKDLSRTPEEIYDLLTDNNLDDYIHKLSDRLGHLADASYYANELEVSKDVTLLNIEYKLNCEKLAEELPEHEEIRKAEISHRYFKALKLAGAYAFIDNSDEVTQEHLESAIKLVEESGEAFSKILTRDRNYERLAKYLADVNKEVTEVDLVEDLPFYKGSVSHRKDLMQLATAFGYRNNIIIKKSYIDGIEFFHGESIPETDLDNLIVAYSDDITTGYNNDTAPWDKLHKLITLDGWHYTAHHFKEGYRSSSKAIPGFNLVILDVDEGISLDLARELLKDYTALYATTKRHTESNNRFRIILPLSHTLKLRQEDYSKFMSNVFEWLPFNVDSQTKDIARKWESNNGDYYYNSGNLLDATLFIPETKKQEEQKKTILDAEGLNNLERWFLLNTDEGSRNNMLIRYAFTLVDQGLSLEAISDRVVGFNRKLKNPLAEEEIHGTILISTAKRIAHKEVNNGR